MAFVFPFNIWRVCWFGANTLDTVNDYPLKNRRIRTEEIIYCDKSKMHQVTLTKMKDT